MGLYFVVREGYDVKRHHLYGCKESRLARLALPSHMTGSPCYCQCYCSASIHKQYQCFVIVNVIARPVFTNNISALCYCWCYCLICIAHNANLIVLLVLTQNEKCFVICNCITPPRVHPDSTCIFNCCCVRNCKLQFIEVYNYKDSATLVCQYCWNNQRSSNVDSFDYHLASILLTLLKVGVSLTI